MICFMFLTSCEAQNGKDQSNIQPNPNTGTLTHEPQVSISVNKKYDENGNQIGFDSTYTSYYSNIEGDTAMMDSLFNTFSPLYKKHVPLIFNQQMENMFFNDSLFYDDFFHTDFFRRRFEINQYHFKQMMDEMDSLKNQFYKDHGSQWHDNTKDVE